jgi:hypothetical protein
MKLKSAFIALSSLVFIQSSQGLAEEPKAVVDTTENTVKATLISDKVNITVNVAGPNDGSEEINKISDSELIKITKKLFGEVNRFIDETSLKIASNTELMNKSIEEINDLDSSVPWVNEIIKSFFVKFKEDAKDSKDDAIKSSGSITLENFFKVVKNINQKVIESDNILEILNRDQKGELINSGEKILDNFYDHMEKGAKRLSATWDYMNSDAERSKFQDAVIIPIFMSKAIEWRNVFESPTPSPIPSSIPDVGSLPEASSTPSESPAAGPIASPKKKKAKKSSTVTVSPAPGAVQPTLKTPHLVEGLAKASRGETLTPEEELLVNGDKKREAGEGSGEKLTQPEVDVLVDDLLRVPDPTPPPAK